MSDTTITFENAAQPQIHRRAYPAPGDYGYDRPSPYLFQWSRLFQATISQAGSKLVGKGFHDRECGIYKCEGGCVIAGQGELVLGHSSCYFDFDNTDRVEKETRKLAALITNVVLDWEPMDPIESMVQAAANHINVPYAELDAALHKAKCGGVFGGNVLSDFFNWNPFSKPPIDRPYQRYCLTRFGDKTDAEVDQQWADEDLGESLLKRLQEASRKRNPHDHLIPLCCSPTRRCGALNFWVNTGAFTQIDGAKTQAELEKWLASDEPLQRDRR